MREIKIVDQTLRDAHQSLWATRMSAAMMLPVLDKIDRIGFDTVDIPTGGVHVDVSVRFLQEDPWQKIRLLCKGLTRSQPYGTIRNRSGTSFDVIPPDIPLLWVERLIANGVRRFRMYDALFDLMGFEKTQRLLERQTIEIAPLAYMRGRTLNQAFVILDEAQNTTPEQMKMFLTRIGFGSKAVVTGDVTQIDLPRGHSSGLIEAQHILSAVRGISFTYFTAADVVRHPLVARIVEAYEAAEEAEPPAPRSTRGARRTDA